MKKHPPHQPDTADTSIFQSSNAEDETDLEQYFYPPADYEQIAGGRSCLIFGAPGTGKTALHRALWRACREGNDGLQRLVLNWSPEPLPRGAKGDIQWVRSQVAQVGEAIAIAAVEFILSEPQRFINAPGFARSIVAWYIHKAIQGNLETRLGPLLYAATGPGRNQVETLLQAPAPPGLHSPTPEKMILELLRGLAPFGLSGIWVLSDGLETWAETDPDHLALSLGAMLSTLSLFERTGLAFKFCLPSQLLTHVTWASTISRRRVEVFRLNWKKEELEALIATRLKRAFGKPFSLDDLGKPLVIKDKKNRRQETFRLADWLFERTAGSSPREWQKQTLPLLEEYLHRNQAQPLPAETWLEILRSNPPTLWLDDLGRKVYVGGREVALSELPPSNLEILRYLYRHNGRVVPKAELYYQAYLHLDFIPSSKEEDKSFAEPDEYNGLVDTVIYRLRQAIEPDPKNPIMIETVRGHGVVLHVGQ